MKNLFKLCFALLAISSLVGCSDDTELAPYKPLIFSQTFQTIEYGSGSTEVPIDIEGWSNFNTLGSRVWIGKYFSSESNRYTEFSSFYSDASNDPADETWLITSKLDFTATANEALSFRSKTRFANGAELKVLVSTDFDGTQAGAATATWTELTPTLPAVDDAWTNSGALDLSTINSNSVYIAFKYIGSKSQGKTTTFQLDNIKIYENK